MSFAIMIEIPHCFVLFSLILLSCLVVILPSVVEARACDDTGRMTIVSSLLLYL